MPNMPDVRSYWAPAIFVWFGIFVMMAMNAPDIWAGNYPGNDDMMRHQQVRDLLAGQGWYDVSQSRFETAEGGLMHWSRIPDVFLAGIILVTQPIIGTDNAEHLALLVWPLILLTAVMASLALVLKRLGAAAIGTAMGLLMFALSTSVYQFWPGRIDHHGLEVTLVIAGLAAVLSPGRSRLSVILAALMVTLMISVAIESLPYAGALIVAMGLLWIVRGADERERLMWFGISVAGFAALAFVLDAPGASLALRDACDAFGTGHLVALMFGGGLLAGLGLQTARLHSWQLRFGGGAVAGALTLAAALIVTPQCLGSPYAALSSTVQVEWLNTVGEARNILKVWHDDPARVIDYYSFILVGLLACGWAIRTARTGRRAGWCIIMLMIVLGALTTSWQIRAVLFAHIFAAIPVGFVLGELFRRYWAERGTNALLAFSAVFLLANPVIWKEIGGRVFAEPEGLTLAGITCREPGAYQTLSALPQARVFSLIDLGTSILVRTDHTVFSAPYHRNPQSIEYSATLFQASPDAARRMLSDVEADYLLYCRGMNQAKIYAHNAPESFAAKLETSEIPGWLSVIGTPDDSEGVVQVYRVTPSQ